MICSSKLVCRINRYNILLMIIRNTCDLVKQWGVQIQTQTKLWKLVFFPGIELTFDHHININSHKKINLIFVQALLLPCTRTYIYALNERVITKAQHKLIFQLHFWCINLCNILSPHRGIFVCLFLHLKANIYVQRIFYTLYMPSAQIPSCVPAIVRIAHSIQFVILFQKLLPAYSIVARPLSLHSLV